MCVQAQFTIHTRSTAGENRQTLRDLPGDAGNVTVLSDHSITFLMGNYEFAGMGRGLFYGLFSTLIDETQSS